MRSFETLGYSFDLVDLSEIRQLDKLFAQHEEQYSEEAIKGHAREDAEHNLPPPEQKETTGFEKELLHSAARLASKVASVFKGPLEIIDAKIKAEEALVQSRYQHAMQSIDGVYELEREAAQDDFGLKDAHKQFEQGETRYNAFYEKYQRPPVVYIPHWLYVILAVLIFLGEVPLNALVFQIFGENQVMTWVMAFVVGLAIPLSAHFIGIKLREHPDGFSMGNALKGMGCLVVVVAALYGLSLMRQTYLAENQEALGLTQALVQSSFMFFYLNLAVLAAATFVAYLAHDSVPGYEIAEHQLKLARKKLVEKKEQRRVKALRSASEDRQDGRSKAHEEYREGLNKVVLLKGSYDQLLKDGQDFEARTVAMLNRQVSIYRRENVKGRSDKKTPVCFAVDLSFPLELMKFGEKLPNDETRNQPSA